MNILHCPACGNSIEVHSARGLRNPFLNDPEWLRSKYWDERLTSNDVARAAGLGKNCGATVLRALRAHGIGVRKRGQKRGSKEPYPLADFLQREYTENGRTLANIGLELGVTRERVRQLVKKCGIAPRGLTRHLTDAEVDEVLRLRKDGALLVQIARKLKITPTVLSREMRARGMPIKQQAKSKYDHILTADFLHRE